jgi:8-oxo-dGTP pyrophosphatase MutT (NUDIX family)
VFTKEGKFLLFQQRKYAIPGETLSPVGGFINDGETPFDAARREVFEELGVGSKHTLKLLKKRDESKSSMEAKDRPFGIPVGKIVLDAFGIAEGKVPDDEPQWVFLGRYRTAANRGGGFLYSYLLMDALPVIKNGGTAEYLRSGDAEEQKLLSLTKEEVSTALAKGEFQEVKWTATLSLSLLHMQKQALKKQ